MRGIRRGETAVKRNNQNVDFAKVDFSSSIGSGESKLITQHIKNDH